jgi:hypothetical protein
VVAVAALGAVAVLAVWPVLRAGYPAIGDGLNHFYRLVEFEHLLAHGEWFPRWASDLGYGYGYPLFNYYPPLTYYLGALLHGLGLNEADSLLAVYAGAWLLARAALSAARERGGPGRAAGRGRPWPGALSVLQHAGARRAARDAGPGSVAAGVVGVLSAGGAAAAVRSTAGCQAVAALVLTHLLTALLALPLILVLGHGAAPPNRTAANLRRRPAIPNYWFQITCCCWHSRSVWLAAYFVPRRCWNPLGADWQLTQPGDLDFTITFELGRSWPCWPRSTPAGVPGSRSSLAYRFCRPGLAGGLAAARAAGPGAWDAGCGWALGCGLPLCRDAVHLEHLQSASLIQFPWRLGWPACRWPCSGQGAGRVRGWDRLLCASPRRWRWRAVSPLT